MATAFIQNWFDHLSLLVGLALSLLSAFEVSRRGWFRVRPVLSTFAWLLAAATFLLVVLYLLQIPDAVRYLACRAYFAIYYLTDILLGLFTLAVLYEFLFRMAGTSKTIQRTAIAGFIVTIGLTTITALWMMNESTYNMQNASKFVGATTSLALVASGLLIFFIKKANSLFLESRLSIFLAALVLCNFFDLLSNLILSRRQQTRLVVSDVIWITFAILLYRALKRGPAIPSPAIISSAGLTP